MNHGCIPTKSLLYGVKLYRQMKCEAELFGVTASAVAIDPIALWKRAERTMNRLRAALRCRLEDAHVEITYGDAHWKRVKSGVFEVYSDGNLYQGAHLILATGGRPIVPDIPGMTDGMQCGFVVTPRKLLETPVVPRSIAVLGGGTIRLEFSSIYFGLGSKVTVIERSDGIGGGVDQRISAFLLEVYRKRGVEVPSEDNCGQRRRELPCFARWRAD